MACRRRKTFPSWALQDVVPGIIMGATQENPAPGRVLPYRDHRIDAAAFKPAVSNTKSRLFHFDTINYSDSQVFLLNVSKQLS